MDKKDLFEALRKMVLVRNFEIRAEAAYQQGKVGGFLHTYIGQEAIAAGATQAIPAENWWATTYRCHALALMLGVTPEAAMCELYGRVNGNALGRGGSMHMYTDRLLGGFGIVGGQIPIATGAAFSAKARKSGEIAICFLGDGAVPQGAFHESLNLASLWNLPCIYVIENNQWGMGTAVDRAVSVQKIAEKHAKGYGINGYTFDGMDFFVCYEAFKNLYEEVKQTSRPVLAEFMTERFRGHSVSDPGLYRSKEALEQVKERDPIKLFLDQSKLMTEEEFKAFDKEQRQIVAEAMKVADQSPWPDPVTLEEGVYAP